MGDVAQTMLAALWQAAHAAGFNVQAPAVQAALIELYTAQTKLGLQTRWLEVAERGLDHLRQMRRGTDY